MRSFRSVSVVLIGYSIFSCSSSNNDPNEVAGLASAPNPTVVLPQCTVETDSSSVQAYCLFNSAVILQSEGYLERAKEEFLQVIALDDQWTEAYTRLGDLYFRAGDYDRAEEMYIASVQLDNTNSVPFHNLGVIYDVNGRQEDAIANFIESIRLNPRSAQAHHNLGLVYSRNSDLLDKAIVEFLGAIELDPTLAIAHYDLGRIYEYLNRSTLSLEHYQKARELGYRETAEQLR